MCYTTALYNMYGIPVTYTDNPYSCILITTKNTIMTSLQRVEPHTCSSHIGCVY